MASLNYYGNCDVNRTWTVTNFRLYTIQLWSRFFDIFVDADVVHAESGEVYSVKNPVEPP